MIDLEWWHWALLGMGLILSELVVPTFVLVWFGLGALLAMGALLLVPDLGISAQIFIWTAASILMTFLWFKVFRKDAHKSLVGRASAHIEGEIGMIAQAVAPFQTGKIRFQRPIAGSDVWECRSEETLAVGSRAKVVQIEGNSVLVISV